jgi:hypothetical protein
MQVGIWKAACRLKTRYVSASKPPQKEKVPMPFAKLGAFFIQFCAYPSQSTSLGLTLLLIGGRFDSTVS